MAATLPESTQPEAVALVLWQGEGFLQVTVRVGRGGGQWVARALTFSERDSISERWTTVGLTIATLVGETRVLDTDTNARKPLSPTPTPLVAPVADGSPPASAHAPQPPPAHDWNAGAGFLSGPAWSDGHWQQGAWLSLSFRFRRTPLLLQAAGSYALSDGPRVENGDLSTRWATLSLGAGVCGTWRALNLAGRALGEVAFRRVDTEWRGHAMSDHDFPLRLRAFASFPADGSVAATAGAVMRIPPSGGAAKSAPLVGGAFATELMLGLEVRL